MAVIAEITSWYLVYLNNLAIIMRKENNENVMTSVLQNQSLSDSNIQKYKSANSQVGATDHNTPSFNKVSCITYQA